MDSILISVKKSIGPVEAYTPFDDEIIMHTNSVLMTLNQLGIGPKEGFVVHDNAETWSDFLGDVSEAKFEAVKTYVGLKVKLVFDPPSSSTHLQALQEQAAEYEWRLNTQRELNV